MNTYFRWLKSHTHAIRLIMKNEIINEIDHFLAMTLETDNDILTEQFAYIKARIDTQLRNEPGKQGKVNQKAFNLMHAKTSEDIRFLFLEKDNPKPVADKAIVLARLQDRVTQVRKLIEDN